jgi:Fic family protein
MAFTPDESTTVAIADATEAAARVDEFIRASGTTSVLSVLSKSESIASSLMEEIGSSTHNVVLALEGDTPSSDVVRSVVKNIGLTDRAIGLFGDLKHKVTVDDLVELQAELVRYVSQGRVHGANDVGIKTSQNRIGGSSMFNAAFIPTPPQYMPEYLADLVNFINDHPRSNPIVAAAFAHAQFETLHPFPDGNGRTGRAIVQGMLRRDGVVRHGVFPISAIFRERSDQYVRGLNSFRADGEADVAEVNRWVRTFCHALADAAELAKDATDRILQLQEQWKTKLAGIRADALEHRAVDYILEFLTAHSGTLAKHFGVSEETARNALKRLEAFEILESRSRGRRRVYFSPEIVEVIDTIESAPTVKIESPAEPQPGQCGAYMPKSRTFCNLKEDHSGHHQHRNQSSGIA